MKRKFFLCPVFLLALAWLSPALQGHCAAKTPEEFVGDFYAWYLQADTDGANPLNDEEIFKYVAAETLEYLHTSNAVEVDYFLQVGMAVVPWDEAKVIAQTAIPMANGFMVVPVTFKFRSDDWNRHVIVFVKQDGEAWSIFKVTNIFPYL
jgi:hypothetical protein